MQEKDKYYYIAIYRGGKSSCIDASDYIFDTESETISLLDSWGRVMRTLDFKNGEIDRIAIYNKANPQEGPIQQILGRPKK